MRERVDVADAVHRLHEQRPEGAERGEEDLALQVRAEREEEQRDQRRRRDRPQELDRHAERARGEVARAEPDPERHGEHRRDREPERPAAHGVRRQAPQKWPVCSERPELAEGRAHRREVSLGDQPGARDDLPERERRRDRDDRHEDVGHARPRSRRREDARSEGADATAERLSEARPTEPAATARRSIKLQANARREETHDDRSRDRNPRVPPVHRRRMGRRTGGATFEDRDPFTGDVVGRRPGAARARTPGVRSRPRPRRSPSGRRRRPPSASGSSSRRPTCSRRGRTRSSRCSRARPAARSASACSRCTSSRTCSGRRRRSPYAPIGEVIPSDIRRLRDGAAPARRRRRRDRAVERGADPLRALDRGAARAREHRRAQAVRALARRRRPRLGRDLRRGRPAAGRAEHRHARSRRRGRDRRRADREPARSPHQLHRLDRDRPQARGGGRPEPEADRARARRLQPADRPRRRRPRVRGQRDGVRRVPAPGPDLHVGARDHRRARDRRRVHRAARREDEGPEDRRPEGARHDHRAAHHRGRARNSSSGASRRP